jgi:hypothetical protein
LKQRLSEPLARGEPRGRVGAEPTDVVGVRGRDVDEVRDDDFLEAEEAPGIRGAPESAKTAGEWTAGHVSVGELWSLSPTS